MIWGFDEVEVEVEVEVDVEVVDGVVDFNVDVDDVVVLVLFFDKLGMFLMFVFFRVFWI